MTAPEKLYTPQGEIEVRAGLVPIEELLHERDELVAQVARLRAATAILGRGTANGRFLGASGGHHSRTVRLGAKENDRERH